MLLGTGIGVEYREVLMKCPYIAGGEVSVLQRYHGVCREVDGGGCPNGQLLNQLDERYVGLGVTFCHNDRVNFPPKILL